MCHVIQRLARLMKSHEIGAVDRGKRRVPGRLHEQSVCPLQLSLPNGMTVFLIEDHEVPLVKGTMLIRGGAQADPPNKVSDQSTGPSPWLGTLHAPVESLHLIVR